MVFASYFDARSQSFVDRLKQSLIWIEWNWRAFRSFNCDSIATLIQSHTVTTHTHTHTHTFESIWIKRVWILRNECHPSKCTECSVPVHCIALHWTATFVAPLTEYSGHVNTVHISLWYAYGLWRDEYFSKHQLAMKRVCDAVLNWKCSNIQANISIMWLMLGFYRAIDYIIVCVHIV